jgi:hypothetical protein
VEKEREGSALDVQCAGRDRRGKADVPIGLQAHPLRRAGVDTPPEQQRRLLWAGRGRSGSGSKNEFLDIRFASLVRVEKSDPSLPNLGRPAPFAELRARFHNCSCKNGGALASTHSLSAPILVSNTEGKEDPSGIVGHS